MIDINSFKNINDTYGHIYGDKCLIEVSHILKRVFYRDHIFRYGGDKFIIFYKIKNNRSIDNKLSQLDKHFQNKE